LTGTRSAVPDAKLVRYLEERVGMGSIQKLIGVASNGHTTPLENLILELAA
jgi:hypothetical protein